MLAWPTLALALVAGGCGGAEAPAQGAPVRQPEAARAAPAPQPGSATPGAPGVEEAAGAALAPVEEPAFEAPRVLLPPEEGTADGCFSKGRVTAFVQKDRGVRWLAWDQLGAAPRRMGALKHPVTSVACAPASPLVLVLSSDTYQSAMYPPPGTPGQLLVLLANTDTWKTKELMKREAPRGDLAPAVVDALWSPDGKLFAYSLLDNRKSTAFIHDAESLARVAQLDDMGADAWDHEALRLWDSAGAQRLAYRPGGKPAPTGEESVSPGGRWRVTSLPDRRRFAIRDEQGGGAAVVVHVDERTAPASAPFILKRWISADEALMGHAGGTWVLDLRDRTVRPAWTADGRWFAAIDASADGGSLLMVLVEEGGGSSGLFLARREIPLRAQPRSALSRY